MSDPVYPAPKRKSSLPGIAVLTARLTAPVSWNVEFLLFQGIILLGLTLRLANITHEFDPDEIFTAKIAGRSFLDMLGSSLADRSHPPLYNILLWVWKRILGPTEVATRLLGICLFVPFMFMTRLFLRGFCSRTGSTLTLFLLATSPFFVFYGQTVRVYPLLSLLLVTNLAALTNVCTRQDRKSHLLWFVSCALLINAAYLSVVFIALESIVILTLDILPRLRFLACTLGGMATVIPWATAAFWGAIMHGGDPIPHISWIRHPTFEDIQWFYASVLHHGRNSVPWFFEFIYDHIGAHYKYLIMLAFSVATTLFTVRIAAAKRISAEAIIILAFAFVVPSIFYVISIFGHKSVFLPRQLMGAAFGCIVLLGTAVPESRKTLTGLYVTVCVLYGLIACSNILNTEIRPNHKEMAAFIASEFDNPKLVTQDDWDHLLPMIFYRDKPAYSLKYCNSTSEELLYLCENGHCEEVYTGRFRSRAEFLKAVSWGDYPGTTTINLFRIQAATRMDNR